MTTSARQIHLATFLFTGALASSWRHPAVQADNALDLEYYKKVLAVSEQAKFDAVFMADSNGGFAPDKAVTQRLPGVSVFDPLTLMSVLSAFSSKIGLIYTADTSYTEPYIVARQLASLDHLSGGRAGWNLVTTKNPEVAFNFSRDAQLAHAKRYERASEFIDVVKGLWDSFEDDAFVHDQQQAQYYDPAKLHTLNHQGEHFSVRGPLNIARPVQGHPVISQAGASEPGKLLGARTADIIFTASQTLAEAQAFYRDIKHKAEGFGRDPETVKVLPGASIIWGASAQEAEDKHQQIQALVHPEVGLNTLESICGVDLSQYPLDGPFPELPETNQSKSQQKIAIDIARRENLSIRQLYLKVANSYRHHTVVGDTRTIADDLEQWFVERGADGFVLFSPLLLQGFEEFATHVVPELQKRGLFRKHYSGNTLREHLGLDRPHNHFSIARQA